MASLMENMIEVMQSEYKEYEALLQLSEEKTAIIVAGDLEGLQKITDSEQDVVGRIHRLEKKRLELTTDIAEVLNLDKNTMKIRDLIPMLEKRPLEQQKLQEACDQLQGIANKMKMVNEQNGELIKHSLEMVEFELTLLQSAKTAPQTANYNKAAYNMGSQIGNTRPGFDTKQ